MNIWDSIENSFDWHCVFGRRSSLLEDFFVYLGDWCLRNSTLDHPVHVYTPHFFHQDAAGCTASSRCRSSSNRGTCERMLLQRCGCCPIIYHIKATPGNDVYDCRRIGISRRSVSLGTPGRQVGSIAQNTNYLFKTRINVDANCFHGKLRQRACELDELVATSSRERERERERKKINRIA